MTIVRPRRIRAFVGRLREPAATSALLVGGLISAAAVALPAAAGPNDGTATPAATATRTAAPTSTRTSAADSTAPRTTSSSHKVTCSWAPSHVSGTTATSITFHVYDMSNCIYSGPSSATIDVYLTKDDAVNGTNKVGSTVASWGSDGTVTGLTPNTEYYWIGSDQSGVRGPVRTAPSTSTSSPITTYCTIAPVMIDETGMTWISFDIPGAGSCGYTGSFSVTVYANKSDAQARIHPVGSVSAKGSDSAVVTGLKAGKKYFFVTSDRSYVQGPVRTLKKETTPPSCTATYTVINSWSGGYVAEVTVTAAQTSAIGNWTLRWPLADGEGVDRAWGATVGVTDYSSSTRSSTQSPGSVRTVIARNPVPDSGLAAGASTRFAFLGTSTGTPTVPTITCGATS